MIETHLLQDTDVALHDRHKTSGPLLHQRIKIISLSAQSDMLAKSLSPSANRLQVA